MQTLMVYINLTMDYIFMFVIFVRHSSPKKATLGINSESDTPPL